ncbi:MAG: PIN domain-containing protein, partial [Myxococcota bacterium]|nr:PIN domain-containing protein [Myxococcota bacterium]
MVSKSHKAALQEGRTFVLDTNVLLYDPNSLDVFEENDLVIPITVIEEIDRFKKDLNETGRNARAVSRRLDSHREQGSLSRGVQLEAGGTLRVEIPSGNFTLPAGFAGATNDNAILQTVLSLAQRAGRGQVVFVTRDTNMRLKADALGISAEDYEHAHLAIDEQYSGVATLDASPDIIGAVYERGWIPWEESTYAPNQFVILRSEENSSQTAMVRFDGVDHRLKLVQKYKEGVWGIFARNKEQLFALDLLMDDSISLVTLDGMAGTGKTLVAIATGLQKVTDQKRYRKLVVSRPIFPL